MDGKPLETEVTMDGPPQGTPPTDRDVPQAPANDTAAAPAAASEDAAPAGEPASEGSSLPPEEIERLTDEIVAALKTVYDPEIPVDIYELGLIYKIDINNERVVAIDMTLTAPGCPVAGEMPQWIENAVNAVPGVQSTKVNLTFDPPWSQARMSDEARLALNMF